MVSGAWTDTMNLTEPQAGSDLSAVQYLRRYPKPITTGCNGRKIFITWGDR